VSFSFSSCSVFGGFASDEDVALNVRDGREWGGAGYVNRGGQLSAVCRGHAAAVSAVRFDVRGIVVPFQMRREGGDGGVVC